MASGGRRWDFFTERILRRMGLRAMQKALPAIPNEALRKGLNFWVMDPRTGRMQIPHYWALYVHDGRGPFGPEKAEFLCWFRNPLDDPRLRNGVPPVRAYQLKRLTAEQFYFWLDRNREADAKGLPRPMIVTRYVRTPMGPTPFFSNDPGGGMAGFVDEIAGEIGSLVREEFRDYLGDLLNIKDTATVRVG